VVTALLLDIDDPRSSPTTSRPRRQVNLLAIAEGFAVSAAQIPELVDVPERRWVLLAATDLFEAWAIGWPPGGKIELHDHGHSSGAVVVARGSLVETRIQPTQQGVATVESHNLDTGGYRTFGSHYVHDIVNAGPDHAVSVHVYGPKLTSMSYYRLSATGRLQMVRAEGVEPVGPFDVTRAHDPS
jgi:predicted metal-dependent enzyme (double-stranded beta helix superfamily)